MLVFAVCATTPFVSFVLAPAAPPISKAAVSARSWQQPGLGRTANEQRDAAPQGTTFKALLYVAIATAASLSSLRRITMKARVDSPQKEDINTGAELNTASVGTSSARLAYADDSLAGGAKIQIPFVPSSGRRRKTLITRNLLMPLNVKDRKPRKPLVKPFHHCTKWKFRGYDTENNTPYFGKYALQAREEAWISSKCIETVRRVIVRTMARKGKSWIRIFPDQGITARVAESRMGAGKGSLEYWVKAVRPGQILFEIDGVSKETAMLAFHRSRYRLSCKTAVLIKDDGPSRFELGLEGEAGAGSRAERARAAAAAREAAKKK
jgi:large subunit ribosomal protein L16